MKSLQINFENLRHGLFEDVFAALEAAFRKFGIDYYIIGAFARDLWMNDNEYLPERRMTLDLDLAIYIAEWKRYDALKQYLQKEHDFLPDKEPYRLHSKRGLILDLIPFGGVEKDHQVYLDGNPPIQLSVFGTKEVIGQAVSIKEAFNVITIPGLCVLKLISWSQRPEWRAKDLDDFWYVLENYSDIDSELIFSEEFVDLLEVEPFDLKVAFASILGRQMRPIISEDQALADHVIVAIQKLLEGFTRKDILEMYESEPTSQKIRRWRLALATLDALMD